jgi:hypothetical protein
MISAPTAKINQASHKLKNPPENPTDFLSVLLLITLTEVRNSD